jgi:hypothetical protein
VVAEWAYIEEDVQILYAFLMSRWSQQMPGQNFSPGHPLAYLTFETLQTLQHRLTLLNALAKWALSADHAAEVDQLVIKIRARAKERNTVAHGKWGVADDQPEGIILLPTFGQQLVYKPKDFDQTCDRITELHMEISRFTYRLSAHVASHGWRAPEPHETPGGVILAMDQE